MWSAACGPAAIHTSRSPGNDDRLFDQCVHNHFQNARDSTGGSYTKDHRHRRTGGFNRESGSRVVEHHEW